MINIRKGSLSDSFFTAHDESKHKQTIQQSYAKDSNIPHQYKELEPQPKTLRNPIKASLEAAHKSEPH